MTSDNCERICPLSKFIKRLYEKNNLEHYYSDYPLQDIEKSGNETLKTFALMLFKNYGTLFLCTNSKEQCCSYLNYWMDEQKENYISSASDGDISQLKVIEDLWSYLNRSKEYNIHCERKKDEEKIDDKKKRIYLITYCENRNYLKMMCEKTINRNTYCSLLPKYINNYYNKFKDRGCLKGRIEGKDYTSHISGDCTLYDVSKTFPYYIVESEKLVQKVGMRDIITECHITDSSEGFMQDLPGEAPELVTTQTSPNEIWKIVLYPGITLLGFFFSFLFLYKYTPLRLRFLSTVIKKKKFTQYIDDKTEHELLGNSLGCNDYNSENEEYNFSYQSA
ncbi:PIR Superfamily Protein [Plasmodium ovale curtisi]|uniref:PIR Superfamily Protein n=1 Tax=Plasmodium ovale curtisi TaxID=864141 RepID=A0A1A8VQT6_PLAOA|nr:PIR Superfamily Protein [Plasmodium ovale curtisi]